jgi:hypothetical protein
MTLDDDHVAAVCKPGSQTLTCRYLARGGGGWRCAKLDTALKQYLDQRVAEESMLARGDNCEGRP